MNNQMRRRCIGGCGREVLTHRGAECRKCSKKRIHAGQQHLARLKRSKTSEQRRMKTLNRQATAKAERRARELALRSWIRQQFA